MTQAVSLFAARSKEHKLQTIRCKIGDTVAVMFHLCYVRNFAVKCFNKLEMLFEWISLSLPSMNCTGN
jgi:hypothetical protein